MTEPVNNSIGVKQSDVLGPMLFTFFHHSNHMQLESEMFCHAVAHDGNAQMTGRPFKAHGEPVTLLDSEYADDTAVIFDNRNDAIVESNH